MSESAPTATETESFDKTLLRSCLSDKQFGFVVGSRLISPWRHIPKICTYFPLVCPHWRQVGRAARVSWLHLKPQKAEYIYRVCPRLHKQSTGDGRLGSSYYFFCCYFCLLHSCSHDLSAVGFMGCQTGNQYQVN